MNGRKWTAAAAVFVVLLAAGLLVIRHRTASVAGPPVFVEDGCTPSGPVTAAAVGTLPAPAPVPGVLGPVLSATVTDSAVILDIGNTNSSDPQASGIRPERLVGLDPRTLAPRWRWAFPADPGPVVQDGSADPWVTVAGDLALAITGIGGPRDHPRLDALDVRTGKPRWSRRFPAGSWPTAVHIDLCRVVINDASDDRGPNGTLGLWGLDLATGRVLWQNGPAAELLCTDPEKPWFYAASGGHLLRYRLADGEVTAVPAPVDPCGLVRVTGERRLDRTTGKWYTVDWSRPAITAAGPGPVPVPADSSGEFTLAGDVLVIHDDGRVTVCERRSGSVLWREDGTVRGYFAAAAGNLFFRKHSPFTAKRRTVSLSAADPRTGRMLWETEQFPGTELYPAVDPRTGTVLLRVSAARQRTSRVYGLDPGNGRTLWSADGDWAGVTGPWLLVQTGGRLRGYLMS